MKPTYNTPQRHQQGATLIVALILLLVMSIIAFTSMSTSVLEEKMSVNLQNYVNVFQVAESGIDQTINNLAILEKVTPSNTKETNNPSLGTSAKAVATVDVLFVSETGAGGGDTADAGPVGMSWEDPGTGDGLVTRYYEAESNSNLVGNTNIKAKLNQGFYYCAKCQ